MCMKKRDLIKKLESIGFTLHKHGSNHDLYIRNGIKESVPRHAEINEELAKAILRRNGYKGK